MPLGFWGLHEDGDTHFSVVVSELVVVVAEADPDVGALELPKRVTDAVVN